MDTYTLRPNDENIKKMLNKDILKRNEYVVGLVKWINSLNGNAILSLEGDWGSGKTFLLKQLELVFNDDKIRSEWKPSIGNWGVNLSDFKFDDAKVIYYDAWENDSSENPLLNLVYNLSIGAGIKINRKEVKPDVDRVIEYTWSVAKRINPLFEVIDFIKQFIIIEETNESKLVNLINDENVLKDTIKEFINKIKEKSDSKKTVIVIDELDRCRPEFALKIIESVKHYFCEDGIIVILSFNPKEMFSIIKKYYGNEVDANIYLDKIIDVHFQVPDFTVEDYLRFILGGQIFNQTTINAIKTVINRYKFSLRIINRYIGALKHLMRSQLMFSVVDISNYSDTEYILEFIKSYIVPYLVGVRIYDVEIYNSIISGSGKELFVEDYFSNSYNKFVNNLYKIKNEQDDLKPDEINNLEREMVEEIYDASFTNKNISNANNQKLQECIKHAIKACNLLSMTDIYMY